MRQVMEVCDSHISCLWAFPFVKCLFCVLLTRLIGAFFFPGLPYPSFWVERRAVHTFVPLKVTAADLSVSAAQIQKTLKNS